MTKHGYRIHEVTADSPAQKRLEAVGYELETIRVKHGARIAVMRKLVRRHPLPENIGSGAHLWSVK